MEEMNELIASLQKRFKDQLQSLELLDCVTVELAAEHLQTVCRALKDEKPFQFDQLIDVCGVDYHEYGLSDWSTHETTSTGFARGVRADERQRLIAWDKPRYAAVYHLLSVALNQRVRLKVYLEPEPSVPSVIDIWKAADWFEREAFDLFGIVFEGHPDLRRILTDYGFVGHPLRKDFPLIGEVEMRYDAKLERCVYEPVSIQPRVNIPKVIRDDARYINHEDKEAP